CQAGQVDAIVACATNDLESEIDVGSQSIADFKAQVGTSVAQQVAELHFFGCTSQVLVDRMLGKDGSHLQRRTKSGSVKYANVLKASASFNVGLKTVVSLAKNTVVVSRTGTDLQ